MPDADSSLGSVTAVLDVPRAEFINSLSCFCFVCEIQDKKKMLCMCRSSLFISPLGLTVKEQLLLLTHSLTLGSFADRNMQRKTEKWETELGTKLELNLLNYCHILLKFPSFQFTQPVFKLVLGIKMLIHSFHHEGRNDQLYFCFCQVFLYVLSATYFKHRLS